MSAEVSGAGPVPVSTAPVSTAPVSTAPVSTVTVTVIPVTGLPEIIAGADLAALIAEAAPDLRDGDILVVTSKIVSKAEGRVVTAPRDQAGRADGVVGLPGPPRPAHRVGDDHAEAQAGAVVQRLADPAGGLVGVGRQQHDGSRAGVGLVHPGRGQDQAVPGLRDGGGAALGDYPHRLGLDGLLAGDGGHPALRLAHDLRGDDEDVVLAQVGRGVGDEGRQVAARGDLGQPGDRHDGNGFFSGGRPPQTPPILGGPIPPDPPWGGGAP